MTGKLRTVVSKSWMSSTPRLAVLPLRSVALPPFAALPLLAALPLMFAVLPLLVIAGCAETGQDASTASREAPPVQTPAMSAASEAPDAQEAPEGLEAPESSETPELAELAAAGDAPKVAAPSHEPVYLTSETTASMDLPFSDAVRVGRLLFLSGQIGNIPGTTDLAPGGIQGEARQTMENIRTVLEANGSSMDRVIKATVMLADIAEWPAFNEVYVTYFPGDKPARSAFAGSGLAFGARCEVEVIATVGE